MRHACVSSSRCSIPCRRCATAPARSIPGRMRGLIEFNDVSFSYDGKRPAIADLSFTALPGETIALVGSTGAGKSTALVLLHRAFDPQSGVIKIDGMDIKAVKLAALRHNIGVVYQEALLFNRSIAENLRVGNPDATDAATARGCGARAGERLDFPPPGRLEGTVGERGRSLSGWDGPEHLYRARAVEGSTHPDPRRGDQRARRHHRAQGAGRARRGDERPHHLRDRTPAGNRAKRHPYPGVRSGPRHRTKARSTNWSRAMADSPSLRSAQFMAPPQPVPAGAGNSGVVVRGRMI